MQFDTVGSLISNTIKTFSVGYDRINKTNVFTSGDPISGTITLEVTKDCKVQSLCIKLRGNAKVRWNEGSGKNIEILQSREKYFSILQFIIQDHQGKLLDVFYL
uniref:Arrestin-like N-terminal domain-containing protein n=1 Tax=Salarias fasciatus TaxID=181472 RepID=A0A672FFA4_SALFA